MKFYLVLPKGLGREHPALDDYVGSGLGDTIMFIFFVILINLHVAK